MTFGNGCDTVKESGAVLFDGSGRVGFKKCVMVLLVGIGWTLTSVQ